MEKYNIFLGSDIANTYDDAKKFTLDRVEEYVEFENKKLKLVLESYRRIQWKCIFIDILAERLSCSISL